MNKVQKLALYAGTEIAASTKQTLEAVKFAAPDIGFAIFFVGTIILGSVYVNWILSVFIALLTLKNRLSAINQQQPLGK